MSYTITSDCIDCGRCLSVCPTQAIQTEGDRPWIDPSRCDQCQSAFSVAQCWSVCPTNSGCVLSATSMTSSPLSVTAGDYWESWFTTYNQRLVRLKAERQSRYWSHWFNNYSQRLRFLQTRVFAAHPVPSV